MCSGDEIDSKQTPVKVVGGILVVVSLCQFVVAGMAYSLTDVKIGAWWGAILPFVAGVCGLMPATRGVIIGACVTASIGLVVAMIGFIVDLIGSAVINSLVTCVEDDGEIYGSEGNNPLLALGICSFSGYKDQCTCSEASGSNCWLYTLENSGDTCAVILDEWPTLLSCCAAFGFMCFFFSFVYSILTCCVLCAKAPADPAKMATGQQVQQVQQPQYGQVPQQQYGNVQQVQMVTPVHK